MAKYNIHGVKAGDRVRILEGHHGAGTVITLTKVVNRITHYAEGLTDEGRRWVVPLHWIKRVEPEG